jgi:DNA-binding beta-propeller fold protein YncE
MTRKIKKLIKDFGISSFNYSGGMGGGASGASVVMTTKGDIVGYDTARKRIGIGANDEVLTADSTNANGLAWKTAGGGAEYSQLTTATTFTPTVQTGLVKVTVDGTDVTGGSVDINVDGSLIKNVTSGTFENRVVNPTTSLSLVSIDGGLGEASYSSKSMSVNAEDTAPQGLAFSADGTKCYMTGQTNDNVYQYTLSTAWDISTGSYASKSMSTASQENQPQGVAFSSDGTKCYVTGRASDTVWQYTLSTAWDISTGSYASKSMSVASQDNDPRDLAFSSDGTKCYVVGITNDNVYQYTLSTAWDISTGSYASKSMSVASQDDQAFGLSFNAIGTRLLIVGNTNDTVYQYTLSTAWDISTGSYDSVSFSVASQDTMPHQIFLESSELKFYVLGGTNKTIFQYSIGGSFAGTARISVG